MSVLVKNCQQLEVVAIGAKSACQDRRTDWLVREGGLRNISHDFNRRRSMGSNLG